jgi:2-polyprenyl-6-methoxyphenol hydroxylase-like FAD-dependent oxidoreductase
MLLARKGYRVLLLDKATFPSDVISTHVIWPQGCEALDRWGLLGKLEETGAPAIARRMKFDVGPFALKGGVPKVNGGRGGLCPRRTVLDKLLADAAVMSGAELREAFTTDELIFEGEQVVGIRGHSRNGARVEERARIVIGADGVHSLVAKAVQAREYDAVPPLVTFFYSYFSGIDIEDVEQYVRAHEGGAYFPTHDGLTLIATGFPSARFQEVRTDIEGNVRRVHDAIPGLKERLDGARREEEWRGTAGVPNYFRTPYGPGWALVGDAGYCKDPLTAQGIVDSFHDAENLVEAIDASFGGSSSFEDAGAAYEAKRNERVTPLYHFTCELARLEPPPPPMQQLFAAMRGNQRATDGFFSAICGAAPLPAFMSPENIGRIMAEAGETAAV